MVDNWMEHRGIVVRIARELYDRRVARVTLDDLCTVGITGLWKSAESYPPDAPCNFPAYAALRVRTEIIDYLRLFTPRDRTHDRRRRPPESLPDDIGSYREQGFDRVDAADQVARLLPRLRERHPKAAEIVGIMLAEGVGHCIAGKRLGLHYAGSCHHFDHVRAAVNLRGVA